MEHIKRNIIGILLISSLLSILGIGGVLPGLTQDEEDLAIIYSSYFGGAGVEHGPSFTFDTDDNMYIAGMSINGSSSFLRCLTDPSSGEYLITDNAYNQIRSSDFTALFVSKLSADGLSLIFSTWIGGLGELCPGWSEIQIALDHDDNIIIAGDVRAQGLTDFPTTPDALNISHNGNVDNFLIKLSNNGSELLYSTFIGGSSYDRISDLKIDADNNIWITGSTDSSDFPITSNAIDPTIKENDRDVYILKLEPKDTAYHIAYSSFIGGSKHETFPSIAFDSTNNIILVGHTVSEDFPVTVDALQSSFMGGSFIDLYYGIIEHNPSGDIFYNKFSPDGSTLLYSTYLGGNDNDFANDIIIDLEDNLIIVGSSTSNDYPITGANAIQTERAGGFDATLTKISPDNELVFSTFWGGTNVDFFGNIELDAAKNIVVSGLSRSFDFPLNNQGTTAEAFGDKAIIGKFSPDGTNPTFVFIEKVDGAGMHLDSKGNIAIVGTTDSIDIFMVPECFICGRTRDQAGERDIFIYKLKNIQNISTSTSTGLNLGLEFVLLALISVTIIYKGKNRKS